VSGTVVLGCFASKFCGVDAQADKRAIALLASRRQIPLLVILEPMRGIIRIRFTN
jgi:hypothetical protein